MKVKVMIVCPFWGQHGNVGLFRVERFVEWLHTSNYEVHVVTAGWSDRIERTSFGSVITVTDPLRIYPDRLESKHSGSIDTVPIRKPNRLRRWLAYAALIPDLHVLWAKSVLKSHDVRAIAKNCRFFLASSPPESSFIAVQRLADLYQGKFVMDMRDGWLDEPMKPLLRSHGWQRFRESQIERKMLRSASIVQVTSIQWANLLEVRYPEIVSKIRVIPNVYPVLPEITETPDFGTSRILRLVHAGRISSSRPERDPDFILSCLYDALKRSGHRVEVNFIGSLTEVEITQLSKWVSKYESIQSSIIFSGQKSRVEVLTILAKADGLLLLSNSKASIPAKYFDYAVTGRPVLCDTVDDSAVQDACSAQPRFHLLIRESDKNASVTDAFINQVAGPNRYEPYLDVRFEESTVRNDFLKTIEALHD